MVNTLGRLEDFGKKVSLARDRARSAEINVGWHQETVITTTQALEATRMAQEIIQSVALVIQTRAHDRVALVVSRCLAAVFDEPYEFKIIFDRARNQTEARLVFVLGGEEISPMEAAGGGVVDVAAFALRVSSLMLSRPGLRRLVVLDEPFRFVSAGYRDRVRGMLQGLSADLGIQFIFVTHMDALRIGTVHEIQ